MSDKRSKNIGTFLVLFGSCTVPIALAQLIIGGLYLDSCPANRMMPTFNIVSGVFGILGALFFLIAGILHLREKDGNTWTIVTLIGGFIVYGFFIPWYMYGGTLTSVNDAAKSRQNTDSSNRSTYCISQIQQSIDGIVLLYWLSMVILLICIIFFYVFKQR